MVLVIVTDESVVSPDVVISPPAKRVLPLQPLVIATRVSSALANDSTLSVIALDCSRVSSAGAYAENSERGAIRRSSRC